MELIKFLYSDVAMALGISLLHSLWQAALLAVVLKVMSKHITHWSAESRYQLSTMLFCLLFISVAFTFSIEYVRQTDRSMRSLAAEAYNYSTFYFANAGTVSRSLGIHDYLPYFLSFYLSGLTLYALALLRNAILATLLRRKGISTAPGEWQLMVDRQREQWNLSRNVLVVLSEKVFVPCTIGVLKPLILFPLSYANCLPAEQIEALLLHELAHIRRHDYLANILQSIMEVLLFFNPFVRWMSANIRKERENCCDELVVDAGSDKIAYADALFTLAHNAALRQPILAATGKKEFLLERIKNIVQMKTKELKRNSKTSPVLLFLSALIIILVLGAFTPGIFNQQDEKKAPPAKPAKPLAPMKAPLAPAAPIALLVPLAPDSGKTSKTTTKYIIEEDNGERREYTSLEDMPTGDREQFLAHEENEDDDDNENIGDLSIHIGSEAIRSAEKAMREIDFTQISKGVGKALKEVDWKKINKEMEESLKSVNWDEINKEMQKGLEEAQKEMEKARLQFSKDSLSWSRDFKECDKDVAKRRKEMEKQRERAAEIREEMAEVRREAQERRAEAMREREEKRKEMMEDQARMRQDQQRERAEMQREMERLRQEGQRQQDEMRRQMDQMRKEMDKLRQERDKAKNK